MAETAAPAAGPRGRPGGVGRLAVLLAGLSGWRRLAAAAGLGAVAALAMPPACAVPLLLVSFPGLLWLLDGVRSRRGAFAVGWAFGFGFFVAGLYWVAWALTVDLARFFWLIPFAVAGLPALLALFTGAACLALHLLRPAGLARVLALAALWAVAEWLRGHLLTGFPWNLMGYGWTGWAPVLQSVALFGIYGLSLVTVAVAGLPYLLAGPGGRSRARGAVPLAAGLVLVALIGAAGAWRLSDAGTDTVPGVGLRLVQPNIPQTEKWDPDLALRNFQRLLELSLGQGQDGVSLVVWPESAVPYLLERDALARTMIADVVPAGGFLLTGATRVSGAEGEERYHNSLLALDEAGTIVAGFDKAHLVPFGEYVPLRRLLPVDRLAPGMADFTPGPGMQTLRIGGLPPVGPLICYEVIFPGEVTAPSDRPAWLLNVTNDAWYGHTAGPHQHFAIARTRAVEEGLPLARAAMTGISGLIDPYGRVVARLELGRMGALDRPLPAALPPTPYARFGDLLFGLLAAAALLPLPFAAAARRPSSEKVALHPPKS